MRLVSWLGLPAVLSVLAVLSLLAPAASAEIYFEDVRVDMGPEQIDASLMDHRIEGDEARDLRVLIDREHGDDDGEVDQDELDAFIESQKQDYNEQLEGFGGAFIFEPFQVRGKQAHTRHVTEVTFSDSVLGDVGSDSTIRHDVKAELLFFSTESSRVEYSFKEDFSKPFSMVDMRWGTATFQTTSGWAVDPASISPGGKDNPFLEDGTFVVPYDASSEFSSSDEPLVFEIVDTDKESISGKSKDSKGSPVLAFPMVLGVLLAGLAAARRSRC